MITSASVAKPSVSIRSQRQERGLQAASMCERHGHGVNTSTSMNTSASVAKRRVSIPKTIIGALNPRTITVGFPLPSRGEGRVRGSWERENETCKLIHDAGSRSLVEV